MTFRLRQRRVLCAYLAAGLAVMTTAATAAMPAQASADSLPSLLSAAPLGLNAAPWDYIYAANTSAGGGVDVIQPLLQAAGIDMLRYGGGSYADYYDWQTNTNIQNCLPDDATASFTSSCSSPDSLDFSQFSQHARAIGAQSFIITGTAPAASFAHGITLPAESVTVLETQ
jgi:hypothetical protein